MQPVIPSVVKGISGRGITRTRREYIEKESSVLLHHLNNNIEITNYFNYPRFNGVFSRNNLPIIKDRAFIMNFDYKGSKGTHCVSLFIDRNLTVYFDSFEVECIPHNKINKKIKD